MRSRFPLALAALALAGGLAACGSGSGGPRTSGPLGALGAVSDTSAHRSIFAINNFAAMYRAAGVSASSAQAPEQSILGQVLQGGPLGASFIESPVAGRPLGYPRSAVTSELSVGTPPNQLAEIFATVSKGGLTQGLSSLKPKQSSVDGSTLFDLGTSVHLTSAGVSQSLISTRYIALSGDGRRAVSGGRSTAQSAVTDLAGGTAQSDSLAQDPEITPLLRQAGTSFTSLVIGDGLITPALGAGVPKTAAALQQLSAETGIDKLKAAPLMVGIVYPTGSRTGTTATAMALYPSAAAAQSAISTVVHFMTVGTSLREEVPYTRLWQVNSSSVSGKLAIVHLTLTSAASATDAIEQDDFPLFWRP